MSGWKSYEETKVDYVRQAKKKNPERGQEIGEIFFFLSSKLLFMKHRLSEYKKMTRGGQTDKIILRQYGRDFFRIAHASLLDSVILEIVNFTDKKVDGKRKHLSLYSFKFYLSDNRLEEKIGKIRSKALPVIQKRNESVAHWGRVTTLRGDTTNIYIDDLDRIVELIAEVVEYAGERLLGLDHYVEKSESYDPWELGTHGDINHVITHLKHYEWFLHKHKQYATSGEPFLSPRWFKLHGNLPQSVQERKDQEERLLALFDT